MENELETLRAEKAKLREALVGLVGCDNPVELLQMEAHVRSLPAPMSDKAASIDAIQVLIEVRP